MKQRVQKLISAAGLMSRRAAEELIAAGRVQVNGKAAVLGASADPLVDTIRIDGKPLPTVTEKFYVMLHKPRGYVCTLKDEKNRKDVTELVQIPGVRLYPVGRLDMYSEGLLLMTNDGEFANRCMHPSFGKEKIYRVWIKGEHLANAAERLCKPIDVDGCFVTAKKVEAISIHENWAEMNITIGEGRNRQIRKMCESCGLKVTRLIRISEAGLSLGKLPVGQWRYLTGEEKAALGLT